MGRFLVEASASPAVLYGGEVESSDPHVLAYALASLYMVLGTTALVQLVRIQMRLPEYGWTTQKVFHLLNVICLFARTALFCIFSDKWMVDYEAPPDMPMFYYFAFLFPGQIYFTTYTLLILFWAEIYHQARSLPLNHLRPAFLGVNVLVYALPLLICVAQMVEAGGPDVQNALKYAITGVMCATWLIAALGFAFYGGKLFVMLRRFPLESKGRRKKLQEVGIVAGISTTCFVLRAGLTAAAAFVKCSIYVHFFYFVVVEVLPVAVILFVLRKLPPKRTSDGYHAIR